MKHKEILDKMTLEQKCQMLSGRDIWSTHPVETANVPSIFLSDGPSGLRKQLGASDHLGLNASQPATCWPSSATIANSWDETLAQMVGEAIGQEAQGLDVQVVLGPGLNTKRSPLCGRNFEYFSEDPYLSGKMAAAYIRGIQSRGVAACPKHFAANSQELRRMANDSVLDERTYRELYLTNFEIAVKEGNPQTIMTSYNLINGTYAHENKKLLKDILRTEWGFDGAVVSDWGGCNDIVESTKNGANLEMPGTGGDSAKQLVKAVENGTLSMEDLNSRVDELINVVLQLAKTKKEVTIDTEKHTMFASKAAEESIVLLKNEENILPLEKTAKVAVIGDFANKPRYQGAGSSMVNPTSLSVATEHVAEFLPENIGYAQGFLRADKQDTALLEEAKSLAAKADVVLLYLGLPEVFETEGQDREHIRIPQNQVTLLETLAQINTNIIVVLSAGSCVEMPWLNNCKALIYGGLGGQAGATAMLRAIVGEVNPSGKLAETFPLHLEDCPVSRYYPGTQKTSEYREAIYVGYRYFETAKQPVRFPFGYGLSYTSFEYSNLEIGENEVTFTVKNTGDVAGAEIAQMYVSKPKSDVFRAIQELKGFTKVSLEPKESKTLTIKLDDKAFRYFNVETNKFEIEGGTYVVSVGKNVQELVLSKTIDIVGTNAQNPYTSKPLACYKLASVHEVSDESFSALLGREIPPSLWEKSGLLSMNDTIGQMYYAKSGLARLAHKILTNLKDKSIEKGTPDLNILFIYNMPFRGIAKMMNGMVTMEMAESILVMVNGHFFKGFGSLAKAFFSKNK